MIGYVVAARLRLIVGERAAERRLAPSMPEQSTGHILAAPSIRSGRLPTLTLKLAPLDGGDLAERSSGGRFRISKKLWRGHRVPIVGQSDVRRAGARRSRAARDPDRAAV